MDMVEVIVAGAVVVNRWGGVASKAAVVEEDEVVRPDSPVMYKGSYEGDLDEEDDYYYEEEEGSVERVSEWEHERAFTPSQSRPRMYETFESEHQVQTQTQTQMRSGGKGGCGRSDGGVGWERGVAFGTREERHALVPAHARHFVDAALHACVRLLGLDELLELFLSTANTGERGPRRRDREEVSDDEWGAGFGGRAPAWRHRASERRCLRRT